MKDPRMLALARALVRYSCSVQKGEHVLIEDRGIAPDFDAALIREVYAGWRYPRHQPDRRACGTRAAAGLHGRRAGLAGGT